MYIRKDISFPHRTDLDSNGLEILWCDILLPKSKPIVVGACYSPPIEEVLFKIRSDAEIYLLGDFNICFFQECSNLYKKYLGV